MKEKKKSLRLEQFLYIPLITFLILLFCGISVTNAQIPQQIAKKALAATVLLVMEDNSGKPLGLGSGFFVDTNLIVTNFHVIDGAAQGTAKRVGQEMEYTIEGVTTMDESHDLAILQVLGLGVQPLSLGDSDTVEIGDTVYVAGNPKGYLEGTFSNGIISAIRGDSTSKRLQMTAPISPGSSGGPVLNWSGEVIGVSFATFRDGQNLNFAIPSNYLKELLTQLGPTKSSSSEKQSLSGESDGDKDTLVEYDKAIQLNPNDAEAYLNRGIAKNKLEQYFTAITDYDTTIRLKPNSADAYLNLGNAKAELGQYDAAIADFDTAIQLKPDYAEAYLNRGEAKRHLEQYTAAIADFNIAIQLKPNYAAYYKRGRVKDNLGQHTAAITDFAKAYYSRGRVNVKRKNNKNARRDFQTALKLATQAGDKHLKNEIESSIRELD